MLIFFGILGTFIVSIFLTIIIVRLITDRNSANAIIAGRQKEKELRASRSIPDLFFFIR